MPIKNIIFDFGDVFINLDKNFVYDQMNGSEAGKSDKKLQLHELNKQFEVGSINSDTFLSGLSQVYPKKTKTEIKNIFNGMLLDFPAYRLEFLKELSQRGTYKLFLLSNTNELHINNGREVIGEKMYHEFKNCFEQFYLSHELGLRKPDAAIFNHVMKQNQLEANETLFIDDTLENIQAADGMGIHTWHLLEQEDVVELESKLDQHK